MAASLPKTPPVKRPSLKAAAGEAGLPATPSTPLGASTLPTPGPGGITPDVAKMVGTPNQEPSTVSLGGVGQKKETVSSPPAPSGATESVSAAPATLTEALRRRTASAQVAQQKQQDIDNLTRINQARADYGHFGESAERLIQSYVAQPAGVGAASVNRDAASAAGVALTPELEAAVQSWAADRANPAKAAAVQAAAHKPGLDPASLVAFTGTTAAATALTPEKITLSDDTLNRMGLSPDAAQRLLGPDYATKTVADLEAAAHGRVTSAEDEMTRLNAVLNDPLSGAAERNVAAQELLSRGGIVRATEQQADALDEDVSSGLSVDIGGKPWRVDDLLDDSQMSDLIGRYLREPEDSPLRAELAQKLPALVSFIQKHEGALAEATSELAKTSGGVRDTQAKTAETYSNLTSGPVSLTDVELTDLLGKDVLAGFKNPYGASAPDLSRVGGLAKLLMNPAAIDVARLGPSGLGGLVDRIRSLDPDLRRDVGKLDEATLEKLGFLNDSPAWESFTQSRQNVKTVNDKTLPVEERLKAAFGGDFSFAAARDWLDRARITAETTGDDSALTQLQDVFDRNQDGKIDGTGDILSRVKGVLGQDPPSIKSLLAGTTKTPPDAWSSLSGGAEPTGSQKFLADVVHKPASVQDAVLAASVNQPPDAPVRQLTYADLGAAADDQTKGVWGHLDDAGKAALTKTLDDNAKIRSSEDLNNVRRPTGELGKIPWEAFDPSFRMSHGVETSDDYRAAGAKLSESDADALAETLLTPGVLTPAKPGSRDYDTGAWNQTVDRAKEMLLSYTMSQPTIRSLLEGLPELPPGKTLGDWFADPLGLAKYLPPGMLKRFTEITQTLAAGTINDIAATLGIHTGQKDTGKSSGDTASRIYREAFESGAPMPIAQPTAGEKLTLKQIQDNIKAGRKDMAVELPDA